MSYRWFQNNRPLIRQQSFLVNQASKPLVVNFRRRASAPPSRRWPWRREKRQSNQIKTRQNRALLWLWFSKQFSFVVFVCNLKGKFVVYYIISWVFNLFYCLQHLALFPSPFLGIDGKLFHCPYRIDVVSSAPESSVSEWQCKQQVCFKTNSTKSATTCTTCWSRSRCAGCRPADAVFLYFFRRRFFQQILYFFRRVAGQWHPGLAVPFLELAILATIEEVDSTGDGRDSSELSSGYFLSEEGWPSWRQRRFPTGRNVSLALVKIGFYVTKNLLSGKSCDRRDSNLDDSAKVNESVLMKLTVDELGELKVEDTLMSYEPEKFDATRMLAVQASRLARVVVQMWDVTEVVLLREEGQITRGGASAEQPEDGASVQLL